MRYTLILTLLLGLWGCTEKSVKDTVPPATARPNQVFVLGAIHGHHRSSEVYGLDVLKRAIRDIAPDYVLTEIPPDRFPTALAEFKRSDTITEPRVRLFPEYVDVLFPLSKEMEFEIVPTAGWTEEMSDFRKQKLKAIREDSSRQAEWARYLAGEAAADSAIMTLGDSEDPMVIHTEAYDAAVELWAGPYNEMFNDELGAGGWDNINGAHFDNIEKALDTHMGKGKKFLIIYGAYHKGWFLRALRQRKDVALVDMQTFFEVGE